MASTPNAKENIITKPQTKENGSSRKKVEISVEHLLRALNSLSSPEEKLAAMCNKYSEVFEANRKYRQSIHVFEKQLAMSRKERDILQAENSRAVLTRSKLESLCRELQKQNTIIKDEFDGLTKSEDIKRKQVTEKFQITITDIQSQMNDHYDKSANLRQENENLTQKIKQFYDEYKNRETEYESVLKHNADQLKLSELNITKVCQQNIQMKKENTLLTMELKDTRNTIMELQKQELVLHNQIKLYTEKYSDFQVSLNKSNDIFKNFQEEMNKANKHSKKLQKENINLTRRCETNNTSLIEMAEIMQKSSNQKSIDDVHINRLSNRVEVLEKLCRALQTRNGDEIELAIADNSAQHALGSGVVAEKTRIAAGNAIPPTVGGGPKSTTTCQVGGVAIAPLVGQQLAAKAPPVVASFSPKSAQPAASELQSPIGIAVTPAGFADCAQTTNGQLTAPTYDSGIFARSGGGGGAGVCVGDAVSSPEATPRFSTGGAAAPSLDQRVRQRETRHKRAKDAARKAAAQMSPRSLKRNGTAGAGSSSSTSCSSSDGCRADSPLAVVNGTSGEIDASDSLKELKI